MANRLKVAKVLSIKALHGTVKRGQVALVVSWSARGQWVEC